MNVSQLAKSSGLSASGVRWYERTGVLPEAARQPNGYRDYTEHDRSLLRLVTSLRRLGLAPAEAGRLANLLLKGEGANPEIGQALASHRDAIRDQREELQRLDVELRDLERTIAGTATGQSGASEDRRTTVLFLCNSNSGRSQMGEALLAQIGGAAFDVYSAGINPRPVSPFAVRALEEEGIDWSAARAKSVDDLPQQRFDFVVTLSDTARDECPVLPGPHQTLHWGLDDPGAVEGIDSERLAAYRQVLAELRLRVQPFVELAMVTRNDKSKGDSNG